MVPSNNAIESLMRLLVVAALVALAGCSATSPELAMPMQQAARLPPYTPRGDLVALAQRPPSTPTTETGVTWVLARPLPGELERARAAVSARLRDPYSARFEGLYVLRGSTGGRSVCGMVNAKNAFGGYVGNTAFHFMTPNLVMMANDVLGESLLPRVCQERTV
jgi:hypothetical protein